MNTGMLYEFLTIICDIIGLPVAVWQSGTENLPVFIWPAGKAGSYDHPCTDIRLRKQIEKNLAADLPAVWFENEMVYFGIWKGNDRIIVIGPAVRNEVDGGYQAKYENDHAMHRTLPLKRFPLVYKQKEASHLHSYTKPGGILMSKNATDNGSLGKFRAWKVPAWASRAAALTVNIAVLLQVQYYCTDALGLAPGLVGMVLMASKLFDGFSDLIAGFIIDKTYVRQLRRMNYLVRL